MRRLPVYILLDTSESMIGSAVQSVRSGLSLLLNTLRTDPHALETAWISIITFDSDARQVVPLTELAEVQIPELQVRPGTSLGKALGVLRNCIQGEVVTTTAQRRGDYRPLVFLLTDGQATDDWRQVKQAVDRLTQPKVANFYSIGCGDDVDFDMLSEVSDATFRLADMTPETLRKLFIWLTASVRSASVGAGMTESYNGLDMTKRPAEVTSVRKGEFRPWHGRPLQVFLKAWCVATKQPYLMRYRFDREAEVYLPVESHKLSDGGASSGFVDVPDVPVQLLVGSPPCAHCENPYMLFCGCGSIMCLPRILPREATCPRCRTTGPLSEVDPDFNVRTSAG